MQVEGGSAGGHHSWESLDDLLTSTYAEVRACSNLVLVAGGGIGTPERAADYISGQWARAYDLPDMPVDGVLIGTAVMTAKEAHTSPAVKQLLVKTPGITDTSADADPFAPAGEKWVPSGKSVGGVSSGLSHLHADIYEVENASAACGRLLVRVMKHPEELESRRDEIIKALDATAKPYFGDLASMTYVEWAERFADLVFPVVDPTYSLRFLHLLQRIEARVCGQESRRVRLAVRRRGRCRLRSEGRLASWKPPTAGCRNPRDPGRCGLVPGTRERISQAHAVRAGHRQ